MESTEITEKHERIFSQFMGELNELFDKYQIYLRPVILPNDDEKHPILPGFGFGFLKNNKFKVDTDVFCFGGIIPEKYTPENLLKMYPTKDELNETC